MKVRKLNLAIFLIIFALVAGGIWFFAYRKSDQNNAQDNSQPSGQINTLGACDVFSDEDAKSVFGNDISKLPPPQNEGGYIPPEDVSNAPKVKTESSTCTYVKGKVDSVDPAEEASDIQPDIKPAPEGDKKPANSTESLDQIKKDNPTPVTPPQILANIALHTSTVENAKADFSKAKAKTAKGINGLGDSAFSIQVTGFSGKKQLALTILKGKTLVNITGENMDTETAKKIAGVVLSKLQ